MRMSLIPEKPAQASVQKSKIQFVQSFETTGRNVGKTYIRYPSSNHTFIHSFVSKQQASLNWGNQKNAIKLSSAFGGIATFPHPSKIFSFLVGKKGESKATQYICTEKREWKYDKE